MTGTELDYSVLEHALQHTEGWYWEQITEVLEISDEGQATLTPDCFGASYVTAMYLDLYRSLTRGLDEDDWMLQDALTDVRVEEGYRTIKIRLEAVTIVNIPKGWDGEEDDEDDDPLAELTESIAAV